MAVAASAMVVEGCVVILADQEPVMELWMELVVLAVADSDLLPAPLPVVAATPAAVGPAAVVEPAELAAAAAAAVAAVEPAGLVGLVGLAGLAELELAAVPVVVLELADVVVSFGLVYVLFEQLVVVPVENAVDAGAEGHHVRQDCRPVSPHIVGPS